MMRKLFFIIVGLLFLHTADASTIIAVQGGDWNAGSTWAALQTGTITTSSISTGVAGTGTSFTSAMLGCKLYTSSGVLLGTVASVTGATTLTLAANATSSNTGIAFYSTWNSTGTGTITTSTLSTTVTGVSTNFTGQLLAGYELRTTTGVLIGIVSAVATDNVNLTLAANALSDNSSIAFQYGGIPTSFDDITIPSGITVARTSALTGFNTITIAGTLNVTGGALTIGGSKTVTVNAGGALNIQGSYDLVLNNNNSKLLVEEDGEVYVSGSVTGNNTPYHYIDNYGFIEIDGALSSETVVVTNYSSGSLLIHGNIEAASSNIKIYNYGIITIDEDIDIVKTNFYNYASGKFIVFGDITVDNSSTFLNYGLIQCNSFNIANTSFVNATCTTLTGTVTSSTSSLSVTGSGTAFTSELSVGDLITSSSCVVIGTIASITDDNNLTLTASAYSSNTAIVYGKSVPGTLITLDSFNETSNSCPGCDLFTTGSVYYDTATFVNNPWCNGILCKTWFYAQATNHVISPGRRLWLSSDFLGYGTGRDGYKVKRWFDLANSFGFYMSESTDSLQPVLKNNTTDNVNFNPVVSFAGGEKHLDLDAHYLEATATNGGIAMFAVLVPPPGSTGTPAVVDFGKQPDEGYGLGYSAQSTMAYTAISSGGVKRTISHGLAANPALLSSTTTWGGNQVMFLNGASLDTSVVTLTQLTSTEINENSAPTSTSGPLTLGWASTTSTSLDFDGKIAEIIVYANNITNVTKEAAESYLALKYGITLPHDYRDYYGNVVRAYDTSYNSDVAGLAREDLNLLKQKKSKSMNTGAELTVSTEVIDNSECSQSDVATTVSNNTSYLVWGHNGETVASGNRVYKITASNFNQKVYLQFEIASLSSVPFLIIADDATFTTNVTAVAATNYDDGKLAYSHKFTNNKTVYFKVLLPSATTSSEPGVGINTTAVDSSAELHIVSTDKGILLPALASEAAITSTAPPAGLIFYNTTHKRFMYNAGTAASPVWKFVGQPLKQTSAEMKNSSGSYVGEIRYNTTKQTMWIWNGTDWKELNHN